MASVSPPLHDAMGLVDALMEVMRGTAVSFLLSTPVLNRYSSCVIVAFYILQFPVEVEHSGAVIFSAFAPFAAVMEGETALIAVMRLDVSFITCIPMFFQ